MIIFMKDIKNILKNKVKSGSSTTKISDNKMLSE